MMVQTAMPVVARSDEAPDISYDRLEQILTDVRAEIRRDHDDRASFFDLQHQVGFGMRQALAA